MSADNIMNAKKPHFDFEEPGILKISLNHWNEFYEVITNQISTSSAYIWRGQGNAKWPMISSFDRAIHLNGKEPSAKLLSVHLKNFKYAVRGRRGDNPFDLKEDKDWWALGQHQGLNTPLLDWSESPFVALFFAFSTQLHSTDEEQQHRAVYALNRQYTSAILAEKFGDNFDNPFIHPLVSDNP